MNYTVVFKGARPLDVARKIAEAHVKAVKSGIQRTAQQGPTNDKAAVGELAQAMPSGPPAEGKGEEGACQHLEVTMP